MAAVAATLPSPAFLPSTYSVAVPPLPISRTSTGFNSAGMSSQAGISLRLAVSWHSARDCCRHSGVIRVNLRVCNARHAPIKRHPMHLHSFDRAHLRHGSAAVHREGTHYISEWLRNIVGGVTAVSCAFIPRPIVPICERSRPMQGLHEFPHAW